MGKFCVDCFGEWFLNFFVNPIFVLSRISLTLVVGIILSQWFLNLLPNQALAAELAAQAWFDGRFKNCRLPTRVVATRWNQDDEL